MEINEDNKQMKFSKISTVVCMLIYLVACTEYAHLPSTTVAVPQRMIYKTRDCFDLLKASGGNVLCDKWWVMDNTKPIMILNQQNENDPREPNLSHNYTMAAYSYMGDLWVIDLSNEERHNITNSPEYFERSPMWSPNDENIAYIASGEDGIGDLWLLNLSTGKKQNLSNTPRRDEFCWLQHHSCSIIWLSESVIFPSQEYTGQNSSGNVLITEINLNNLQYSILDNENNADKPSLSSDKQRIAYGYGHIFDLKSRQLTTISLIDYEINLPPNAHLMSPSWSPDGEFITWGVAHLNEGRDAGIVLLNIQTKSAKIVNIFQPYWMNIMKSPYEMHAYTDTFWDPNGKWFASATREYIHDENNWAGPAGLYSVIRIYNREGREVTKLENSFSVPFWSADGAWLAFAYNDYESLSSIQLTEAGTWKIWDVELPQNTEIIDWRL